MDRLAGPLRIRRCEAGAALAFLSASLALSQVPADGTDAGPIEGSARTFLERARAIATTKLRTAACQQIFAEFKDDRDASLDEVLKKSGERPEDHLRWMRFRNGSRHRLCVAPGILAVTSTGSLEVFVCGSLESIARRDPNGAANILIHEELHSLGAGEAPTTGLPSSVEITARVATRCGR